MNILYEDVDTTVDDNLWSKRYNEIQDRIDRHLLKNGHKQIPLLFAAYKNDRNGNPIDNLDKIAIKGRVRLVQRRNEFWGAEQSRNYKSRVVENPTWLQLCALANSMINTTLDYHHVFLEGIRYLRKDKDGTKIYTFSMGS